MSPLKKYKASTQQLAAPVTEISSTGVLSKNWTCTKLLTALAGCVMGCFALPSQIEPLKRLEGKWNKKSISWGVELNKV